MSLLLLLFVLLICLAVLGGFSGYGPTPAWAVAVLLLIVLLILFGLPGEAVSNAASWGTGQTPDASWGT